LPTRKVENKSSSYVFKFLTTYFMAKRTRTRRIRAKRRADGRLDKRTRKGKEIAARMAKARAARKKASKKKWFKFW